MAPAGAARGYARLGYHPMAALCRCLCALLLVSALAHSLPVRTEKLTAEDDYYYTNGNIRCLRCPPGEFVRRDCTVPDTRGECEPCPDATYSEHPSGMHECLRCASCRNDQEVVSLCIATKNTRCRCKKGTFCLPGEPCEICQLCTTSCPENEVVQAPCNSTSDTLCAPPDDSSSDRDLIISLSVIIPLIVILLIIGWVVYRKKKEEGSRMIKLLTVSFCNPNKSGEQEATTQLLPRPRLEMREGTNPDTREEIFSKSCVTVVDLIPPNQFEKVMLKLGLSTNDILRAKMDNPTADERHNAMLHTWHQQKGFHINQLLETLDSLKMNKLADDITDKLVGDGLYTQHPSS